MKAVLICPTAPAGLSFLSQDLPLAGVPLLGQSLLEYWLSSLAVGGTNEALVLAADRPEMIEGITGQGERWGLQVEVRAESRELSPAQAQLKYAPELGADSATSQVVMVDHFPGQPELRLFGTPADCFKGLLGWLPRAVGPDRVGVRQVRPGVWVGTHARISPQAHLEAPCWVGNQVFVGAGARLGPQTIVEDGAYLEPGVELVASWVGPNTFVGQFAHLEQVFAWQNTLLHWPTGRLTKVPDRFLLCAWRRPRTPHPAYPTKRLARLAERLRNKEDLGMLWKQLLLHKEG